MVEIIEVNAEVMIIKGLVSAEESRKRTAIAIEERDRAFQEEKENALKRLKEKDFTKKVLADTINHINWAAERGERRACETGYGNTSSLLRCWGEVDRVAIMELITKQILPILESKGYKCKVEWHHFTQGIYFTIDIFW